MVCYLFFQQDLIIIGISLGCFLIVWPEIIAPEYSYKHSLKARLLLLMVYVFFVGASGFFAKLTISVVNYIVFKYGPYKIL